jgi:hypothetical protein
METIITDEKDREILKISESGRIAAARFPDMHSSTKDYIVSLFPVKDQEKLRLFLDYKSDEDEFCV